MFCLATDPRPNAPVPPMLVPERETSNRGGTGHHCVMTVLLVSPLVPTTPRDSVTTRVKNAGSGAPTLATTLVAGTTSAVMMIVEGIGHAHSSSSATTNTLLPSLTHRRAANDNYSPQ